MRANRLAIANSVQTRTQKNTHDGRLIRSLQGWDAAIPNDAGLSQHAGAALAVTGTTCQNARAILGAPGEPHRASGRFNFLIVKGRPNVR